MDFESSPIWCMIKTVEISDKAKKDLRKIPIHLFEKMMTWIELIENDGLEETRKIRGYRDETLKGVRMGQRSIRLNRA